MSISDLNQHLLFKVSASERAVNVASVPQRSPFRYPGGKTWLVPRIRQWLSSLDKRPSVLVEPFAGGGIVGLTAAFEDLVERVVLVELDTQIAAVWETILGGEAEWLANQILSYDLTRDHVIETLAQEGGQTRERAFRTILKNRTYHGGIMARGASLIKNGENGKGLKSRWYANTLAKRILAIGERRDRFTFVHGDGLAVMQSNMKNQDVVYFIDPPYTAGGKSGKRAGNRLYTHHELDHKELFSLADKVRGDVLMTYDNAPDVHELAKEYRLDTEQIAMKNTHHAQMNELLIGRDLGWAR